MTGNQPDSSGVLAQSLSGVGILSMSKKKEAPGKLVHLKSRRKGHQELVRVRGRGFFGVESGEHAEVCEDGRPEAHELCALASPTKKDGIPLELTLFPSLFHSVGSLIPFAQFNLLRQVLGTGRSSVRLFLLEARCVHRYFCV